MAKRFTSTDIWKEDWFLELPQEYMLAWFYIKDNCNHAGIWKPNKRQLEFITRSQISLNTLLSLLNNEKERVIVLEGGSWYLSDFISFQYGTTLNENNRVHASIVKELTASKIDTCNFEVKMRSTRPQDNPNQGVKDKEKDIDKDKAKVVKVRKSIYITEDRYREILIPLNFSNAVKKKLMEHFKGRVENKQLVTERIAKTLTEDIEGWISKHGEDKMIESIKQSIGKPYPLIYEPKIQNGQKQEQPQPYKPTVFLGED